MHRSKLSDQDYCSRRADQREGTAGIPRGRGPDPRLCGQAWEVSGGFLMHPGCSRDGSGSVLEESGGLQLT